ncbi:DUF6538 domain-containing protein [Aureimonas sp. AU4]|uniref:DUF6538 domain-containing protein n=1 Tax=Aureimonas sp. AU4 TaxID=1638163 RepID=UPI000782A2E6|nr:DUF6538 domain-containing protein [Aureimonas sp. AU4]
MTREQDLRWLVKREGRWYFVRRIPAKVAHLDQRPRVRISTETSVLADAMRIRDKLNAETETYWQNLLSGVAADAHERYQAAVSRARLEGFVYRPAALGTVSDRELIDRLRRLGVSIEKAQDAPPSPDETQLVQALRGTLAEPDLLLSGLVADYESLTRQERRQMSDMQLHKWRLPHVRAVRNIISVIGDKPIASLSRGDAIAFRDWWFGRIEEGLSVESANKDVTHVGKMIARVSDLRDMNLPRQFRGLRFADEGDKKRPPYSAEFIRDRILAPGALDGLNDAARGVVLAMINTGARPSELAGLRAEDIRLDAEIPHIAIVDYPGRVLKTKFSKRELPLVGPSLDGAKLLAAAAGTYKDRGGTLSATVNKFLVENKLTENEGQTLYSFRHGFKDRLTDADAPDLIDAELMGHKFDRPDYGKGPTLAKKLEWVLKVAIVVP